MGGESDTYRRLKRALSMPSGPVLDAFESLLTAPRRNLEISAQLQREVVHRTRMALIFDQDHASRLEEIVGFLRTISAMSGVQLDLSILKRVTQGLDLGRVTLTACGVDLRERAEDSRVKVWIVVVDQPAKINDILEAHGHDADLLQLVPGNVLLTGVDLTLRGQTRLKIYPKYREDELENIAVQARLARVLSPAALELMLLGKRANICFEADRSRTIHVQPRDPDSFLRKLNHPRISQLAAEHAALGLDLNVVSVRERELVAGKIEDANLYWVPGAES